MILYIIIGIIAALAVFALAYKPPELWKIRKGSHYCLLSQRAPYWLWWVLTGKMWCKSMSYTVWFNNTCVYAIDGENKNDLNKLFGIRAFEMKRIHSDNSTRLGWNCTDKTEGDIWYGYYYHLNGKKKYPTFTNGLFADSGGEYYPLRVEITRYCMYTLVMRDGQIDWSNPPLSLFQSRIDEVMAAPGRTAYALDGILLPLFPYFGGDEVAPRDVRIRITDWRFE